MALSPIVKGTIQSAVIGGISNIIAQVVAAQQNNKPITIDPLPLFQFILFALVSTPPNILWQEFLESTFPAHDDPRPPKEKPPVVPKLNKTNTLIKTILDQTLGAFINTLMFSMFMHGIQAAMSHHHGSSPSASSFVGTLLGAGGGPKQVMRWENVNWQHVWEKSRGEFWEIVQAGWKFWPLVSLVNFVFLKTVEARNLLGGLAGLGWGVYISLSTAARK
ncbi:hypothetical protein QBC35DRAFT_424043 [Podospora australis]|uniref:Uncharacterized protein n=1 Tax=Podospora australis TaxID=1536484 RepID=A0AAN6X1R1_9PEZI|nr:hypothetical protein QBC35DRAFT_424043 [Podospora australis]